MKFGVREICDVVLRAKSTQKIGNKIFYKNEPVCYFDTLKTSTLEGAATTVYATGGRGNARLISWDGERTVTFTMEDALISPVGLSILTGAGLVDATTTKPIITHVTETLQIDPNGFQANGLPRFQLKYTPYFQNGEQSIYVMGLNDNGEVVTEPYIYSYANGMNNEITFDRINNYVATEKIESAYNHIKLMDCPAVLVDYYRVLESGAFEVQISPNQFGGSFYLEASTLWRDSGTGEDLPAEFIIPNCRIQSNFTFSMSSSGDPSTFTFTIDAFPDYTRWNKTEKVLADIQVIGATTGNLVAATRTQTWADPQTFNQISIGDIGLTPKTISYKLIYGLPITGQIYISEPDDGDENTLYRLTMNITSLNGDSTEEILYTGTRDNAVEHMTYNTTKKLLQYTIPDSKGLDPDKKYLLSVLVSAENKISEVKTKSIISQPTYYEFANSEYSQMKLSARRQLVKCGANDTYDSSKKYYSYDSAAKVYTALSTDGLTDASSVSEYYTWGTTATIAITCLPGIKADYNDDGALARLTKITINRHRLNSSGDTTSVLKVLTQEEILSAVQDIGTNKKITITISDTTPFSSDTTKVWYGAIVENKRMKIRIVPALDDTSMLLRELSGGTEKWVAADSVSVYKLFTDEEILEQETTTDNDSAETDNNSQG